MRHHIFPEEAMTLKRMGKSLLATAAIVVGVAMILSSFVPLRWWWPLPTATVQVGGHRFAVAVAGTEQARKHGLMDRDHLAAGHGMLFVYPNAAPRRFWMKDTRIPLDILFFDADRRLTQVLHAVPCTANPCAVYASAKPAAWVLELPAGTADRLGLVPGAVFKRERGRHATRP